MPLLSDLGTHTKDDPAGTVTLSDPLEKHLRGSLTPLRPARPTTAIHQRVQALIDTSRAGSEKVARAVEEGGAKVDGLSSKLDSAFGSATQLGQKIKELEQRLSVVEKRGDMPPVVPGESGIPPAELSDFQLICLRALSQVDTQLVDQEIKDKGELNQHLHTKFSSQLGADALAIFDMIDEADAWKRLCSGVEDLTEIPSRVVQSHRLRTRVLESTQLQDKAAQIA